MASIGIAGAGLLGRLLAWRLSRAGHAVQVFDPAEDGSPRFDGQGAAGFTAAGLLSPLAEMENAGTEIARLGWRSIAGWREITAQLPGRPFFAERGSLLLAHRSDLGSAQRLLSRLGGPGAHGLPAAQPLAEPQWRALEPALGPVAHAWLLPGEAQLDAPAVMAALQHGARDVGWHWRQTVCRVAPGELTLADGRPRRFDTVFDVRGLGARGDEAATKAMTTVADNAPTHGHAPTPSPSSWSSLRGVRGETVWLHAPGLGLTRPLRLLHPRHRVYIAPRPGDVVVIGASEIESEDRSPVSVKSAVELMTAACSVLPGLAEARILRLDRNLRPAWPDHRPRVEVGAGLVRINGLFRHGWLLAPALVDDALAAAGLAESLVPTALAPAAAALSPSSAPGQAVPA